MDFEIIDFHTHPFASDENNICSHTKYCGMNADRSLDMMTKLGISKFCGSVIALDKPKSWDDVKSLNDEALRLRDYYGGRYIPGFHIHPKYLAESYAEIDRMEAEGVKLIGEIVPYIQGWGYGYLASNELTDLLRYAGKKGMIFSIHTGTQDMMDELVKRNPDLTIVAAHPGEAGDFERHLNRMKMSENYYLDISGTGIFRYGLLRHGIDEYGKERFLFGSDFPTCAPAAYIGAVRDDDMLSDEEKTAIFSGNAKRLLGIG